MSKSPETYHERKKAMVRLLQELAQWPHCNHEEVENSRTQNFELTVKRALMKPSTHKAGPPVLLTFRSWPSHPFQNYGWQMATEELVGTLFLNENEARERLEELQTKYKNKEGMPSATDGSKGQWRAAMLSRIQTQKWLVGDLPNGIEVCDECGQRHDRGGVLTTREGDRVCIGCKTPMEEVVIEVLTPDEFLKREAE